MLAEIPPKTKVFIDANIFIYHFTDDITIGNVCADFLSRVEKNELIGFTSTNVISEVLHRLIIAEVVEKYKCKLKGIMGYLKKNRSIITHLCKYAIALEKIQQFNIHILPVSFEDIIVSEKYIKSLGLLTSDSISLSVMRRYKINDIATNDFDFERVKEIRTWKP